jgi:hypothetical protein
MAKASLEGAKEIELGMDPADVIEYSSNELPWSIGL